MLAAENQDGRTWNASPSRRATWTIATGLTFGGRRGRRGSATYFARFLAHERQRRLYPGKHLEQWMGSAAGSNQKTRSEEHRVGNGCDRTCRSRCTPEHQKKIRSKTTTSRNTY